MLGILPFLIQWVALGMFGITKNQLPTSFYGSSPSYPYAYTSSAQSTMPPKSHWSLLTEFQHYPEEEIESFLPQICNMILDRNALNEPAIFDYFERIILSKCAKCLPFGLRVCGVLRGAAAAPAEGLFKNMLLNSNNLLQQRKQETLRTFHERVEYFTAHGENSLPSMVRDLRLEYFQDFHFLLNTLARLGIELKSYPVNQRNMHLKRALSQCNTLLYYRMLSQRSISNLQTSFEDIYAYHDLNVDQIAQMCPAAACFSLHFPLQHSKNKTLRILRFVESECELLPSKDRAPYLVVVELLEQPFSCSSDELYTEGRALSMSTEDLALNRHLTYVNPQIMPTMHAPPQASVTRGILQDKPLSFTRSAVQIGHGQEQARPPLDQAQSKMDSHPATVSIWATSDDKEVRDDSSRSIITSSQQPLTNTHVFARPYHTINRRNKLSTWSPTAYASAPTINRVESQLDSKNEELDLDLDINAQTEIVKGVSDELAVDTPTSAWEILEQDNEPSQDTMTDEWLAQDSLRGGASTSNLPQVFSQQYASISSQVSNINGSQLNRQDHYHGSHKDSSILDGNRAMQYPHQQSSPQRPLRRSFLHIRSHRHHRHADNNMPFQSNPGMSSEGNFHEYPTSYPQVRQEMRHPAELERRPDEMENESSEGNLMPSMRGIVRPKTWEEKKSMVQSMSPFGQLPGWTLRSFIVKAGDDLRKEVLAMQIIEYCQKIFAQEGIDIFLRPYQILNTGHMSGLVEFVEGAMSIDRIKKLRPDKAMSLPEYFTLHFGDSYSFIYAKAVHNFVRSLAGYSLITYLAQVRDRHNANLLIDSDGHLVHIDFGFIFGDSPGFNMNFENAPDRKSVV